MVSRRDLVNPKGFVCVDVNDGVLALIKPLDGMFEVDIVSLLGRDEDTGEVLASGLFSGDEEIQDFIEEHRDW